MMKDSVQAGFNAQITMELSAFYTYLSMAAWFEAEALPGFAAWMRHHAEEEMVHAMKLFDFVNLRRGRVQLAALAGPKTEWPSPLAAFEDAFGHERKVSQAIDALVDLAESEHDRAAISFLQWFVDEQVEEEEVVDTAIQKLRRIGDFGPGLYLLDRELAGSTGAEAGEGAAASE